MCLLRDRYRLRECARCRAARTSSILLRCAHLPGTRLTCSNIVALLILCNCAHVLLRLPAALERLRRSWRTVVMPVPTLLASTSSAICVGGAHRVTSHVA